MRSAEIGKLEINFMIKLAHNYLCNFILKMKTMLHILFNFLDENTLIVARPKK